MDKTKIVKCIRLELTESPTASVFLVTGQSGASYGYAIFDDSIGRYCLRLTPEEFHACADDIFKAKRRFFHIIPRIEFEEDPLPNKREKNTKAE